MYMVSRVLGGGKVVLRSKDICIFSDHIKDLPQKGGGGGPSFPLWLDPWVSQPSSFPQTFTNVDTMYA